MVSERTYVTRAVENPDGSVTVYIPAPAASAMTQLEHRVEQLVGERNRWYAKAEGLADIARDLIADHDPGEIITRFEAFLKAEPESQADPAILRARAAIATKLTHERALPDLMTSSGYQGGLGFALRAIDIELGGKRP